MTKDVVLFHIVLSYSFYDEKQNQNAKSSPQQQSLFELYFTDQWIFEMTGQTVIRDVNNQINDPYFRSRSNVMSRNITR